MSEYLQRLARRGAGSPAPKAVAAVETIPALALGDTRGARDEAGAERAGDGDASTRAPSPEVKPAEDLAAGTPAPSTPPDRSAASESIAEVAETSPVPPRRLRPHEWDVEPISRRDPGGQPASTPDAGVVPASTAAAPIGREAGAARASAADPHLSALPAPSHPVDRAGLAMPPARGRSVPTPPGPFEADIAAIPGGIGSGGPHMTARPPGREGHVDGDVDAPSATEPRIQTEQRDAPTTSPQPPHPQVALAPASAAGVAAPPPPAPMPEAPPMQPIGPQVSVSIGRITVQTDASHAEPTELPRPPQQSRFSSMTLTRRHVDRRWY